MIRIRIHMFLGLQDPDPVVIGMDPYPALDPDQDPLIMQKYLDKPWYTNDMDTWNKDLYDIFNLHLNLSRAGCKYGL